MIAAKNYYLFIVLRSELTLCLSTVDIEEAKSIFIDSIEYKDMGYAGFTGFVDWLRTKDERIIGVRYWPFEGLGVLFNIARPFSYVEIEMKDKGIIFYFSDERNFDEMNSSDQVFGDNKIYKSDVGEYLISFNVTEFKDTFSYNAALYPAMLMTNLPSK
jgi:hypothetical protein